MQERKDQHDVGVLLRRRHYVQVVGLNVGKGAVARLDDGRHKAWKSEKAMMMIRLLMAHPVEQVEHPELVIPSSSRSISKGINLSITARSMSPR